MLGGLIVIIILNNMEKVQIDAVIDKETIELYNSIKGRLHGLAELETDLAKLLGKKVDIDIRIGK